MPADGAAMRCARSSGSAASGTAVRRWYMRPSQSSRVCSAAVRPCWPTA
jgi:hypothetical protein